MRLFIMKYWNTASSLIECEMQFEDINAAYRWVYDNRWLPLTITPKP